jgi:hypothetical protein
MTAEETVNIVRLLILLEDDEDCACRILMEEDADDVVRGVKTEAF